MAEEESSTLKRIPDDWDVLCLPGGDYCEGYIPWSKRALSLFKQRGVKAVGDIRRLSRADILSTKGVGPSTLREVEYKLWRVGVDREEFVYARYPLFRTPEGEPTCAKDIYKRQVCPWLRTMNFGTDEVCGYMVTDVKLWRRDGKDGYVQGYLVPDKDCPLWKIYKEGASEH